MKTLFAFAEIPDQDNKAVTPDRCLAATFAPRHETEGWRKTIAAD